MVTLNSGGASMTVQLFGRRRGPGPFSHARFHTSTC
ncbi:DUF2158 domain-containing protein [Nonomuraea corallina]